MGVPLRSTPGPGGGYSLPRGGKRLSPSLTVDEALGLIVSYEALLRYPVHPFSSEGISAVTKLRAALPKDAVSELDRLRRHIAVVEPVREYEAPLIGDLLEAALDGAHLKVIYDSIRSEASERVIFPFGLYASAGFWYCACFDNQRGANVTMRADRFLSAQRVEGYERPAHVPLERWPHDAGDADEERVGLRARVTARGAKASSWPRSSAAYRRAAGWSRRRSHARSSTTTHRVCLASGPTSLRSRPPSSWKPSATRLGR